MQRWSNCQADSADFQTISYSVESCEYRDYGKDSRNVYFKNTKVEGADAGSFIMLEQGYYKDKRYLYFYGKKLRDSDSRKEIKFIKDNKDTGLYSLGRRRLCYQQRK